MKQKFKRFMAGFLAVLTMFTTLFANGITTFAASPSAKIQFWYASARNVGEVSELRPGHSHEKILYAIIDGNAAYCMNYGLAADGGQLMNSFENPNTNLSAAQEKLLAYCLYFGYGSNVAEPPSNDQCDQFIATQAMVWVIVGNLFGTGSDDSAAKKLCDSAPNPTNSYNYYLGLKSSISASFFVDGEDDNYVEIATTRPELLAACQCIFIHPEDEENKHLLGKMIKVPLFGFSVPVLEDEKVELGKGSGVVMCCTFGDLTDLEWYKKHKLTFKEAILQNGTMSDICRKYAGMSVLEARSSMIADLIEQGYMIKQEEINHNVSTHERCGTPMEITIKKQWFIDILSHKNDYLEAGNQINWYPAHMQSRYSNWVENLEWDWCISRQRYFGVPFPVWYCKECGETMVAEIEDLPVNPLKDKPKKACTCGCTDFEPEKDIMDTWATSSVTPLINLDWHDEVKFKKEMAPMSMRPNAHDIIRTWDFYTIVKSLYHTGMIPWNDVMISGHVMASKGEKISKRKSNSSMEPAELIKEFSADAVRLWTSSGSLGNDIVFSEEEFKNANKLINKIWNAAKFVIMQLEGFEKTDDNGNAVQLHAFNKDDEIELMVMDKWIISSYNTMLKHFEKYLEKYEIGLAIGELEKFFWSYCDDYIEIIKNRVYKPEIYGENARKSGLFAAYHTLLGMLKCFAIYIPHVTEEIYQGYFVEHEDSISIHRAVIESIKTSTEIDIRDYEIGEKAVEIISELRKYKSERSLSLKEELNSVQVVLKEEMIFGDAIEDIKATCSCKNITITCGDSFAVVVE